MLQLYEGCRIIAAISPHYISHWHWHFRRWFISLHWLLIASAIEPLLRHYWLPAADASHYASCIIVPPAYTQPWLPWLLRSQPLLTLTPLISWQYHYEYIYFAICITFTLLSFIIAILNITPLMLITTHWAYASYGHWLASHISCQLPQPAAAIYSLLLPLILTLLITLILLHYIIAIIVISLHTHYDIDITHLHYTLILTLLILILIIAITALARLRQPDWLMPLAFIIDSLHILFTIAPGHFIISSLSFHYARLPLSSH